MIYATATLHTSNVGHCRRAIYFHHLDWPLFFVFAVQVGDADEIDGFFLWTQHSSTGPLDSTATPMGILKAERGGSTYFCQNGAQICQNLQP